MPKVFAAAAVKADATVSETNRPIAEARPDQRDHFLDDFLARPGRGRRALRRAAIRFLRLLTSPPLRPFSRFARCLAALRTRPPSRPSATACGFLRRFFISPLHTKTLLAHVVQPTLRAI